MLIDPSILLIPVIQFPPKDVEIQKELIKLFRRQKIRNPWSWNKQLKSFDPTNKRFFVAYSLSLEGFEKMLFTIQNFTQGDLHFTGGIQMFLLGVYNSTGGIRNPSRGVIIQLEGFSYPS